MSYDLAVFAPGLVPKDRHEFLEWFDQETSWSKEFDYNDPTNLSPELSCFFHEIIKDFPPMNGPLKSDGDSTNITDYSCAGSFIYAGFRWSQSESAYATMHRLAATYQCGFFDVSSIRGNVWLPDGEGGLKLHSSAKPWWKFW
ncbi:MAG: hypothetical protein COA78_22405 [Blastopirellula sp.]|nr:MAG: hypothetical protein COA78_22405 [Blastopirellula sp.]